MDEHRSSRARFAAWLTDERAAAVFGLLVLLSLVLTLLAGIPTAR